jgi:hypothetical protein
MILVAVSKQGMKNPLPNIISSKHHGPTRGRAAKPLSASRYIRGNDLLQRDRLARHKVYGLRPSQNAATERT